MLCHPAVADNYQSVAGPDRIQVYHQADIFQFLCRQAVHVVLAAVQASFLGTEGHEPQGEWESAALQPFRHRQQRGHAGGIVRRAHGVGHGVVVGSDHYDAVASPGQFGDYIARWNGVVLDGNGCLHRLIAWSPLSP